MISFTVLSLPPDTLRRMASHLVSEETGCRRWERRASTALVIVIVVSALVADLLLLR